MNTSFLNSAALNSSTAGQAMQNWLSMVSPAPRAGARLQSKLDSTSGGSGSSSSAAESSGGASALASQDVFLQLLVTQLKNQDPESPTDGTQFVTELAQFTTLDQTTQGTSDLGSILQLLQSASAAAATQTGSTSNSQTSNSQTSS